MAMGLKKKRRMAFALSTFFAAAACAALVIFALKDNVMFFYSPSDLVLHPVKPGIAFHLGGLVQKGSVVRGPGLDVHFTITDGVKNVPVTFRGELPDLFREGQGVVAQGTQKTDGTFVATQVLAKHDERYMPREVVDALKRAGRWQETASPNSQTP